MLNNIELKIVNDLEEINKANEGFRDNKEEILNLTTEEKNEYINELSTAYDCTVREVKRAINYYIYDIKQEYGI